MVRFFIHCDGAQPPRKSGPAVLAVSLAVRLADFHLCGRCYRTLGAQGERPPRSRQVVSPRPRNTNQDRNHWDSGNLAPESAQGGAAGEAVIRAARSDDRSWPLADPTRRGSFAPA